MRVINPLMVTVNLMSSSRAQIAIIAYLMIEMGKNPGPDSVRHIFRKDSSSHTVLRTLKLHSTAFGMFLHQGWLPLLI